MRIQYTIFLVMVGLTKANDEVIFAKELECNELRDPETKFEIDYGKCIKDLAYSKSIQFSEKSSEDSMCLRKYSNNDCQDTPEDQTLHFIEEDSPCQPIDSSETFESYILENVGCGYSSPWDEYWSEVLNWDDTNASEEELQ